MVGEEIAKKPPPKYYVLDFDNVLFFNKDNNYKDEYLCQELVIPRTLLGRYLMSELRNVGFYLFTGRGEFQKEDVLLLLESAGYTFIEVYFMQKKRGEYPAYNEDISVEEFNKEYWKYKKSVVKRLYSKHGVDVKFVDDDKEIIRYCEQKEIRCTYFNIKETFAQEEAII